MTKEELETKIDALSDTRVPSMGKADTKYGETLRAVSQISYRYYNDGDKATEGYGLETVYPFYAWLVEEMNLPLNIQELIESASLYENGIMALYNWVINLDEDLVNQDKSFSDSRDTYEVPEYLTWEDQDEDDWDDDDD